MANILSEIQTLRTSLESVEINGKRVFSDDDVQKQVDEALKGIREPARNEVMTNSAKAIKKLFDRKEFADHKEVLAGSEFAIVVKIDKEGNVETEERFRSKRKSGRGRSSTAGKVLILEDGNSYKSWAAMCRAHDLDLNGDSGKRVWERAHGEDADKYPMPDLVDADSGSDD